MGPTPSRRLTLLAPLVLALVATGTAAHAYAGTSAHARTTATRMPAAASPHSPATVVTPPGEATTVAGAERSTRATPARRATRTRPADPAATEVVRLVNVERKKAGCAAVRVETRLAAAARLHSEDMARQDYFSHTSLDGRSPWDRIRAQGYAYGSAENIAAGYTTPAAVMKGWMKSAGHKANILQCSTKAIGIGIGHGGHFGIYWTQDFGGR